MLRSVLHPVFAASALILTTAGLSAWLGEGAGRGLLMLAAGLACGVPAFFLGRQGNVKEA